MHRRRDEAGRRLTVDVHGELQQFRRFDDQFRLGFAVQVLIDFAQQVFQLLRFLGQGVFVAHQRQELLLELGIESGDHELDGVADFADAFVFGGADAFHVPLDLLNHADEFHEFPAQKADFLLDVADVLFVNVFQRLESVSGVSSTPQRALVTDALSARPAIDGQFLGVDFATVLGLGGLVGQLGGAGAALVGG